jgi:hypothetical protein
MFTYRLSGAKVVYLIIPPNLNLIERLPMLARAFSAAGKVCEKTLYTTYPKTCIF